MVRGRDPGGVKALVDPLIAFVFIDVPYLLFLFCCICMFDLIIVIV
jgi:hypothetical protein